ncbi:MAG: hypothetical protein C4586_08495 [Anaerolineaceae bacterium]|nr:MAG: hypothetical protein C4586_08495 [Anaerolineaceae bacterium]
MACINGCKWKGNKLICGACQKNSVGTPVQAADMERASRHEPMAKKESTGCHTPCRIRVHSIRKHLTDPDGASIKAVLDGITKAGILADDNASIIKEVSYSQERGAEDQTIIEIEFE